MILTAGGIKGGSGKTTTATTLAVLRAAAGRDVVLVDADEQQSASKFSNRRDKEVAGGTGYISVMISGFAVLTETPKLAAKYDDVIIDTGGRDSESQRAAMAVSDALLVPLVPEPYDTWTMGRLAEMVKIARTGNPGLDALVYINRAPPRGTRYNEEAAAFVGKYPELSLIPPVVGRRSAFVKASDKGLAVTEWRPADAKAIAEVIALEAYLAHRGEVPRAGKAA